ncbi:MAG TPA: hypothetical protein VNE41_10125 [Chitinophagaceae bacterium]|nr:hypothetical protein [Chitinophagaceae bacterium]
MAAPLVIATTRFVDRRNSAMAGDEPQVKFESHQGVMEAGLLFPLPALQSVGLLKTSDLFQLPADHS